MELHVFFHINNSLSGIDYQLSTQTSNYFLFKLVPVISHRVYFCHINQFFPTLFPLPAVLRINNRDLLVDCDLHDAVVILPIEHKDIIFIYIEINNNFDGGLYSLIRLHMHTDQNIIIWAIILWYGAPKNGGARPKMFLGRFLVIYIFIQRASLRVDNLSAITAQTGNCTKTMVITISYLSRLFRRLIAETYAMVAKKAIRIVSV